MNARYHLKIRIACLWLIMLFSAFSSIGQDVLTLEKGQQPGKATLKQVEWLKGYWTGTGLGGDCEELWMPANDSSMHGVFRFAKNNSLQFTEYMVIEEKNGTLTVRIKHFGAGVEPWEEKDKWVEFPLVKTEGETAWFSGLTYARSGLDLIVTLRMKQGEKRYTEEFRFRKSAL